jgi:HSP20 family molecular chaperone IbpA
MNNKPVNVSKASDPTSHEMIREIADALTGIRNRAYALFEARGRGPDASFDDWFRAERDLFAIPDGELSETEAAYHLKISVPGYTAGQLNVAASPQSVAVRGGAKQQKKNGDEFVEAERKELFRLVELESPIDIDQVKASLEDGALNVTMPKAGVSGEFPAPTNAAGERTAAQAA